MHDYTANILHNDRIRTLRREAADSRLAARAPKAPAQAHQAPRRSRGLATGFVMRVAHISGWARRDAPTHGFGGSLRTATDPQLAEDA
jgi:hypothetical protein